MKRDVRVACPAGTAGFPWGPSPARTKVTIPARRAHDEATSHAAKAHRPAAAVR